MKITNLMTVAFGAGVLLLSSCSETTPPAATVAPDNTPAILKGAQNLKVDVAASNLHWKGEMLGLYSHEGNINLSNGNLTLNDGKVTGGSFVVDMTTIKPTDAAYNPKEGKTPENLVGHLSSPEFFDIANNPNATFTIKSVNGDAGTGMLTIRGKTNEEKIENIVVTPEGDGVKVTGTVKFDRQKYGATFSMNAADKVLSDDIPMEVTLVAKK